MWRTGRLLNQLLTEHLNQLAGWLLHAQAAKRTCNCANLIWHRCVRASVRLLGCAIIMIHTRILWSPIVMRHNSCACVHCTLVLLFSGGLLLQLWIDKKLHNRTLLAVSMAGHYGFLLLHTPAHTLW